MTKDQPSQWWWLHNDFTTKRSPWLQSTIHELNEKTKAIFKLIEEDADSFAQRAEMYYEKRPELICMVQDFYRTHRSLAERYDQVKPDNSIRPFTSAKYQSDNFVGFTDRSYDSYSQNSNVEEESVDSEIDDPELETATTKFTKEGDEVMELKAEIERLREEIRAYKDQLKQKDALSEEVVILKEEIEGLIEEKQAYKNQLKRKDAMSNEVLMLRGEGGRLREENMAQKDQLMEKDEEKMEVIRQLSLAIDVLKQENVKMRDFIAKRWRNPFEFTKLKRALSETLFNGSQLSKEPA